MIRALLVHITRNRKGQPAREERLITGDKLRIGRGTDCKIHLPDPRVNLHHATIRNVDNGKLYIEGDGGTPLNINGTFEASSKLRPGTHVVVGPYELITEARTGDHDFVLTVELKQPLPDDRTEVKAKARTSLAQTALSKRGLALGLAFVVLAAFLVLPIYSALDPMFRSAAAKALPVAADESWNPGVLSAGHQSFGKKCNECHQKAFVHVQDQACETCHKTIGGHIEAKPLQAAVFGATRCAECHRDHKGLKGLVRSDATLCVNCHGDIKAHSAKSDIPNIHDFKDDHPAFALSFATGPGMPPRRVPQNIPSRLVEDSGLKFPHDIHLAAKGVKSPNGRVKMDCGNCHVLDAAGVRFNPISMKDHCEECHRLEFEPAVTTRQVPHGSVREAVSTLREFYAGIAIGETPIDVTTVDGLLRRPNEAKSDVQRKRALEWATVKSDQIAKDLFEVRVCVECHQVRRVAENAAGAAESPWQITPVVQTLHWLPKARFEHFKHKTFACADCHNVAKSKKSSDVAIPDMAKCQECHVGAKPERNKIASTCETCHGFHLGSHRHATDTPPLTRPALLSASAAAEAAQAHGVPTTVPAAVPAAVSSNPPANALTPAPAQTPAPAAR